MRTATTFLFDDGLSAEASLPNSDSLWGDGELNDTGGIEDFAEHVDGYLSDAVYNSRDSRSLIYEPLNAPFPSIISGTNPHK